MVRGQSKPNELRRDLRLLFQHFADNITLKAVRKQVHEIEVARELKHPAVELLIVR